MASTPPTQCNAATQCAVAQTPHIVTGGWFKPQEAGERWFQRVPPRRQRLRGWYAPGNTRLRSPVLHFLVTQPMLNSYRSPSPEKDSGQARPDTLGAVSVKQGQHEGQCGRAHFGELYEVV